MAIISGGQRSLLVRMARESAEQLFTGGFESIGVGKIDGNTPHLWLRASARQTALHPWDEAHLTLANGSASGFESVAPLDFVEPDLVQAFPVRANEATGLESAEAGESCQIRGLDPDWPPLEAPFAWHLKDEFSGLRSAREAIGESLPPILIGILDTGYDPRHSTLPRRLRVDLARNVTGSGPANDATDSAASAPFNNPGHGTATLALLAGNRVNPPNFPHFDDFLGGAPHVDVVPIRIADSVVHFRTSSMAAGIEYAAQIGCQVLSISMGGVPSAAWADAVNGAYEAGVAIFAAAGNRIGPLPPATLVYPARFERVVAVCGFTAAKTPYRLAGFHHKMHGCFGPPEAMKHTIAAYTPNMPWAAMGCGGLVNPDGAGTSSATPQAAAAAALWLQRNSRNVAPWKRVEAVRHAMFQTGDRSPAAGKAFYGNGLLRARHMLDVAFADSLPKSAPAEVSFPWLRLLGVLEAPVEVLPGKDRMFETEALQLYLSAPRLQRVTGNADPQHDRLDERTLNALLEEITHHANASQALKARAQQLLRARTRPGGQRPSLESATGTAVAGPPPSVSSYTAVQSLFIPPAAHESAAASGFAQAQAWHALQAATSKFTGDRRRRHELAAELVQALLDLKSEFEQIHPGVMASPTNRVAAILQSVLSQHATLATSAGLEFAFDETDMHTVMDEVIRRLEDRPKHPPLRPKSNTPDPLEETVRIGLVGDFGTGLYGAPVTAATIRADPGRFDLLVHLGDVYYAGERQEIQSRLIDIWPFRPDATNRSLNGNHDMYSGGEGYFKHLLSKFSQKSSYFSMQNSHWVLIFLDTAYKDNDIGRKQLKWINKVLKQAGDRKLLLFSHHPLFSNFKKQGKRLSRALAELLESQRITAWYWGHEHHCIVYDRHPRYGLAARCLGNGGMPAKRSDIEEYPVERHVEGLMWRRIVSELTPAGLILDGPNEHIPESPDSYLPHSFGTIELAGDRLRESIFSPRGRLLYSGEID